MESKFVEIADKILNNKILHIVKKNKIFRIVEVEFYYFDTDHKDPYVDCCDEQLNNEQFYLRKFPNGNLKEGSFKCIDLAMGNRKHNIYFSLLIRSIIDIKNNILYNGPCLCVNKIFSCFEENITANEFNTKFDINQEIKLVAYPLLSKKPLLFGPRIGLIGKYIDFKNKKYRFATSSSKLKNQSDLILVKNDLYKN